MTSAKILVADDDQTLLEALTMILRDKGYEVVPVSDGQEIPQLLEEECPDLLMLDIMMPKVDGDDLVHGPRRGHGEVLGSGGLGLHR
jgi:DNA-binding response OmpR family regulator